MKGLVRDIMERLLVGSRSPHKVDPASTAATVLSLNLNIEGLDGIESLVNEQPEGMEETFEGAWNRMEQAWAAGGGKAWALGAESGAMPLGARGRGSWREDVTVFCLKSPNGQVWTGTTSGIAFDNQDVAAARAKGFATTTIGSQMAARTGCDGTDPIKALTKGRVSRADLMTHGLIVLFSQAFPR